MRKHKLAALVCIAATLLSGCTIGTKKTKVVLNERQKEILAMQGLPTDYEELTPVQKSAITSIEEFLVYLEETHNEEFTSSGRYYPPGSGESEHIDAHCSKGEVTAWRKYEDGQFTYWDNYDIQVHAEEVTSAISSYFKERYEETYTSVLSIDAYTDVHGTYYIFFLNCDQDQMDERVAAFEEWLKGQDMNAKFDFHFRGLNEEDFNRIELMTFSDIIKSKVELSYAVCVLEENGDIIVRGRDE